MTGNSGLAESVASGVLGRRRNSTWVPFAPTNLDMELVEAADAALTARVPLGVVLPPGSDSSAVLLGAAAVVGAVLQRGRLDVEVAVASTRFVDRSLYDELTFRAEQLASFVPRAGLTGDGRAFVIGKPRRDTGGRLYIVGRAARLDVLLEDLEGLIVTADAVEPDALRGLLHRAGVRVPVVYLTEDPYDPGLDLVREAGGVVWGWDAACLPALAEPAIPPRTAGADPLLAGSDALRGVAAAEVQVRIPQRGGDLDVMLDVLWRATGVLCGELGSEGARSSGRATGLLWAYRVFHGLGMLPTAPSAFDRHLGVNPYRIRFDTAVDTARSFAEHSPKTGKDAWHRWADALAAALKVAEAQPRTAQIVDWARERVESGLPGIVLVRGVTAAVVLVQALHESPATPLGWDRLVEVWTLAELGRGAIDVAAELCVPGRLPRSRSSVFALPPAGGVTVLACGPVEGHRVLQQVSAAKARMGALRRETVQVSAPRLGMAPRVGLTDFDPAAGLKVVEGQVRRALTDDELTGADEQVWEPFTVDVASVLARLAPHDEDQSPMRSDGVKGDGPVTAIAIYVHSTEGPKLLFVPANDILTRRRGTSLARVAAKSLTAGDRLLLVDQAARTDLRFALTDKLSERMEYRTLRMVIDFWHERAAKAGCLPGLTQQAILDRMTGTRITSAATIGSWIRGTVYGPEDSEDLARFARAVGDESLLAQTDGVAAALRTLRRVHIKLGFWLASQTSDAGGRAPEAVIDNELGVRVADLLDTIAEYEITGVDLAEQSVPAHVVGLLTDRTLMTD